MWCDLRRIIPKGSDIPLSQQKISLMMSHINSYAREGLNGKSPYDLFALIYGEETLQKLGIQRIPAYNPQARAPEITRQLTMGTRIITC